MHNGHFRPINLTLRSPREPWKLHRLLPNLLTMESLKGATFQPLGMNTTA